MAHMKRLWMLFWAYWKWFCTALVTSTLVLLLISTFIQAVMPTKPDRQKLIDECLDRGGAWDDDASVCKTAA